MASIPQDCVSEILSYLPEGGSTTRQFRTEKPHIKEYLNSFCMRYTSSNLMYFNRLAERYRSPLEEGLAMLRRAAEYVEMEENGWTIDVPRHQCCGLTCKGRRCKNKTFGLFCSRHEGSNTCYWSASRFTPPTSQLPPQTCPPCPVY